MGRHAEELGAVSAEDLAMPPGLTPDGVQAYDLIMSFVREEDLAFTGGCKVFYSPEEWRARGEEYGTDEDALLLVVYDGAAIRRLVSLDGGDYELVDHFYDEMNALGFYVEECTTWYAVVGSLTPSERKRVAARRLLRR